MALSKKEEQAIKALVWDLETAVMGIHEMRGHIGLLVDCKSPLCLSLQTSTRNPIVAAVMGKLTIP